MLNASFVYPTIPSKDIETAKAFWVDKLGFTVKETGDDGSYILEAAGGSKLCLYPSTFAGTNKATACAFEVTNLESEVREMKSKGITFESYDFPELKTEGGIATMGDDKAAWFVDPDGNIIGIYQPARVLARA